MWSCIAHAQFIPRGCRSTTGVHWFTNWFGKYKNHRLIMDGFIPPISGWFGAYHINWFVRIEPRHCSCFSPIISMYSRIWLICISSLVIYIYILCPQINWAIKTLSLGPGYIGIYNHCWLTTHDDLISWQLYPILSYVYTSYLSHLISHISYTIIYHLNTLELEPFIAAQAPATFGPAVAAVKSHRQVGHFGENFHLVAALICRHR